MGSAPEQLLVALREARDRGIEVAQLIESVGFACGAIGVEQPDQEIAALITADLAAPETIGMAHEALLDESTRTARGAFYTPPPVAAALTELVVDRLSPVVDPACGGGVFLLASARRLEQLGATRRRAAVELVHGLDIDPLAVRASRLALSAWSGVPADELGGVRVGDAFDPTSFDPALTHGVPVARGQFGAVVGNPPFLGQLASATARRPSERDRLAHRFGSLGPYTDTAGLFLLLALELLAEGGRAVLIQPLSLIGARDAEPIRVAIDERACLAGLWVDRSRVFGGRTDVCAPIVARPGAGAAAAGKFSSVDRYLDRDVDALGALDVPGRVAGDWATIAATCVGVPALAAPVGEDHPSIGDRSRVSAGFRQHFYGLRPGVGDQGSPLVTVGLIDPLWCRWGEKPARFDGVRYDAPRVDLAAVTGADPAVGRWFDERLVPKLLVATQTSVVEVVVDAAGDLVPVTPTVVVVSEAADLWPLAAALSAPPMSVWALTAGFGSARAIDRIKLSARQVAELPLPTDLDAWREAARHAKILHHAGPDADEAAWLAFGAAASASYGVVDADLLEWWWRRHPRSSR